MAIRTEAEFESLYGLSGTTFPDNSTGDIGEEDARQFGQDIKDSFALKYAAYLATATGTDTYAISISGLTMATGLRLRVLFTNANTGASTLNLNATGAQAIRKNGSTALVSGDISAGQILELVFDGTNFQIIGNISSSAPVAPVLRAEVNLTNLQVRALGSSHQTIVAAQGANTFIEIVAGYYVHTYGTVAFDHGAGTGFTFTIGGIAQSAGVGVGSLTNATTNRVQRWNPSSVAIKNASQDGLNAALLFGLSGGGADATTGDGTGKIVVYYRVVDLS
jgi:hypothetical protein